MDDTGKSHEYRIEYPIWIEAEASGGTPMCAALRQAHSIAENWISSHMHSHPPIVINITDGDSTDGDPLPEALRLRELKTDDGELLLFNCHLSPFSPDEVRFPGSESDLPKEDDSAAKLFAMSSEIPEHVRSLAPQMGKRSTWLKNRGFVFHADLRELNDLLDLLLLHGTHVTFTFSG